MTKARIAKEAVVRIPNQTGALTHVAKLMADKGIDISALVACAESDHTMIRLITSDHLRTMDLFRNHNLAPEEARVVAIEIAHRPGMLRYILDRLAMEKIDIMYLYASAVSGQEKSIVVLSSSNNDRAVIVLNE